MVQAKPVRVRNESRATVVSLPKAVCAELAIKPGDFLVFAARGGELVARRVDLSRVMRKLAGDGEAGGE